MSIRMEKFLRDAGISTPMGRVLDKASHIRRAKVVESRSPSSDDIAQAAGSNKWMVSVLKRVLAHLDAHGGGIDDAIDAVAGGLHDHDRTLLLVALDKLDG